MCKDEYGAAVERGRVESAASEGARVISLSREGITTPPLPCLNGLEVAAGDLVYFFLFNDGRGMVIAKFT